MSEEQLMRVELGTQEYPSRLLDLEEPPELLYVRGSLRGLEHVQTVAIVGSRKAGVEGIRLAQRMAYELGRAGIMVISGGALGVDAAAHTGCIEAQMPTISVLAGGVDKPTPVRNASVFNQIVEQGALLSEYPPGARPRRYHFHRRNDLIAALGDATVVVRAGRKSGTMITARAASKLGRPLCAIPGALDDRLAEGCHELLVAGAQCVRGASDVIEYALDRKAPPGQLSLTAAKDAARRKPSRERTCAKRRFQLDRAQVSGDAAQLYDALVELAARSEQRVLLDDLKRNLDWSETRLNPALLELELVGAIAKCAGANIFRPV